MKLSFFLDQYFLRFQGVIRASKETFSFILYNAYNSLYKEKAESLIKGAQA